MFVIDEFICQVLDFASRWFCEIDLRDWKSKIRVANKRKYDIQKKIKEINQEIGSSRTQNEYLRRGALIKYRQAQLELIDVCLDTL